ncbi:hypothetical protein JZ751_028041 [Albula glossodonta]|uniref:Uncharacterized protein n=1 Tax=Albula glossodonta TaxID=121402 RepID=A0A8T2P7Z0_9TELE|nr:hypothetical protein JZ751_028041 [Albula glossodonta]
MSSANSAVAVMGCCWRCPLFQLSRFFIWLGVVAGSGRIDKPILKAGCAYCKAKRNCWPCVRSVAINAGERRGVEHRDTRQFPLLLWLPPTLLFSGCFALGGKLLKLPQHGGKTNSI